MTTQLMHFDAAKQALALAATIDEVKQIRDQAEALRQYVRQQGESLEMQNHCAEIKLRAERRAGELLRDMDKNKGAAEEGWKTPSHDVTAFEPPKLEDLGISRMQSSRWQAIADLPEEVFEEHIAEVKERKEELTSAGMLRVAKKVEQEQIIEGIRLNGQPPFPAGKYRVVYADPPWSYSNSGFDQSAASHYPTMATEEIQSLPVPECCTPETVLFLWATSPLLPEAFAVLDAWGFQYKASLVWDKGDAPPMGWFVQTEHEFILIGTREGNAHPLVKPRSIIHVPSTRHSAKPSEVYEIVQQMYPGPYVELFARNDREGWDSWGNQVDDD